MKVIQITTIVIFFFFCTTSLVIFGQDIINKKKILEKDYSFRDTLDNTVRLSSFKGKFVFVDTWYSGCGACITANKSLRLVHEQLKGENIIFLSVSIDGDKKKWISSVTANAKPSSANPWAGKYCPSTGTIVLRTSRADKFSNFDENNDFIKKFNPEKYYPKLLLFDPSGRLISDNPPRPDSLYYDRPEKLIVFLKRYLQHNP